MSDLDTQIRDYARWLADTADAASDAHVDRAIPPPAGRPRWPRRGVLLAAAAAVVALVVGLAAVVRAPSAEAPADPPPPTPTTPVQTNEPGSVKLADGYELAVVGEPAVLDEAEVWQGAQAPPMVTADDVVGASSVPALLEERAPSQVVLPEEFTAEGVERLVTIGEIGGAVVLAHAATRADQDRDVRCVLVAPMNDPTDWLSGCGLASADGTQLGLGGGFGQWIVWTDIPAEAALVELRGTGGASIHQYPIARTVAFPNRLLDGSPLQLVAYDANGETIASPSAPGASADDGSSDTSEIPASATPFAVTGRSRSFMGQAPADARTDPLTPADNVVPPPFVLDEIRWVVGDCCRVAVVLQDERPLYPDDQLIHQITAGNLTWDIYDIGPNDGTAIAAITTVDDLSVSVGGQTLFKDRPGVRQTIDVVESLARTITIEEG